MWAAGPPLHRSEGRVSLIMIWVIITEQRKRKRDGERMEGGWQRSSGWLEKCFSLCLLCSSMTIIHSVGDVLSLPNHPPAQRKSRERGMLSDVPESPVGSLPVLPAPICPLYIYILSKWIYAYMSIYSPLTGLLYIPLLSGLISTVKHISQ